MKHNATVTFWNDFTEMDMTEKVLYIMTLHNQMEF